MTLCVIIYALFTYLKMCARISVISRLSLYEETNLDGKIVGGTHVSIKEVPYQLSLQYDGKHICGASIISSEWALTAAHCVDDMELKRLKVRSGSSFRHIWGRLFRVSKVIMHEKYEFSEEDYDIALMKINGHFRIDWKYVKPVKLPAARSSPKEGTSAKVSGWGSILSGEFFAPYKLKAVVIRVSRQQKCKKIYKDLGVIVTGRMLCAGHKLPGRDSCQGDSGGPLVANNVLVGIVSTGYGCGIRNYPGIYTNVGYFRNWIKKYSGV